MFFKFCKLILKIIVALDNNSATFVFLVGFWWIYPKVSLLLYYMCAKRIKFLMTRLSVCGLGVWCNEMSDTPMLLIVGFLYISRTHNLSNLFLNIFNDSALTTSALREFESLMILTLKVCFLTSRVCCGLKIFQLCPLVWRISSLVSQNLKNISLGTRS